MKSSNENTPWIDFLQAKVLAFSAVLSCCLILLVATFFEIGVYGLIAKQHILTYSQILWIKISIFKHLNNERMTSESVSTGRTKPGIGITKTKKAWIMVNDVYCSTCELCSLFYLTIYCLFIQSQASFYRLWITHHLLNPYCSSSFEPKICQSGFHGNNGGKFSSNVNYSVLKNTAFSSKCPLNVT